MPIYIPKPLPPAPWHNIEVNKRYLEVLSAMTDVYEAYRDTIGIISIFSNKKRNRLKLAEKRYEEINKEYRELWLKDSHSSSIEH